MCGAVGGWHSTRKLRSGCSRSCSKGSTGPIRKLAKAKLPHAQGHLGRSWPSGEDLPTVLRRRPPEAEAPSSEVPDGERTPSPAPEEADSDEAPDGLGDTGFRRGTSSCPHYPCMPQFSCTRMWSLARSWSVRRVLSGTLKKRCIKFCTLRACGHGSRASCRCRGCRRVQGNPTGPRPIPARSQVGPKTPHPSARGCVQESCSQVGMGLVWG